LRFDDAEREHGGNRGIGGRAARAQDFRARRRRARSAAETAPGLGRIGTVEACAVAAGARLAAAARAARRAKRGARRELSVTNDRLFRPDGLGNASHAFGACAFGKAVDDPADKAGAFVNKGAV
jgi:hypothetical protein